MNELLSQKLKLLPDLPGSYQMRDKDNNIIYVGKAKNLNKRVNSYFVGVHDEKTTRLVENIEDFTYIIAKNEPEAFLLEINLIKEHRPRYNIMLMDDKTYPYIEFTKERHPKLVITRKVTKKNSRIFGPYPNVKSANETIDLLNKLYPLRKCEKLPNKVCLYYHMGQCLAPCVNEVSKETYEEIFQSIKTFLNGNDTKILASLKEKMKLASENLEFEKAKEYRDLINSIKNTIEDKKVSLNEPGYSRDVFGILERDSNIFISILFFRSGKLVLAENKIIDNYEDINDVVQTFIYMFYEKNPLPKEINIETKYLKLDLLPFGLIIKEPIRGKKRKILELANMNAKEYSTMNIELANKKKKRTFGVLDELHNLLSIKTPYRIEMFDNSSIMGTSSVSSMITYVNGQKSPKDYRKFMVESGAKDDYHIMQEIVYRRYYKVLIEDLKKPDLIIMDGGIQQVHACEEVLNSLALDIPVLGLKKDDHHKTESIIYKENEYKLDKHSDIYRFLFEMQEEVHRFAITYHRKKRTTSLLKTKLEGIEGVGKTTIDKLYRKYKTISNMEKATYGELKELKINKNTIENILNKMKEWRDE